MNLHEQELAPRVARVEASIEALTRDLSSVNESLKTLGETVRVQSGAVEKELHDLAVAVTAARAPRPVEWGTIVATGGLVLALGAAVLSPVWLRIDGLDVLVQRLAMRLDRHERLRLHPVGESRIDALERRLDGEVNDNTHKLSELSERLTDLRIQLEGRK